MIRIGLTGGIASGKSTVSKMISELGFPIIDADLISREVVEPGEPAYRKIVEVFGADILYDDGALNRNKLGSLIFSDKIKRDRLNQIVHPQVRQRMLERTEHFRQEGETAVILDIPLLIESQLLHFVDKVLLVDVQESIQLKRLMERNNLTVEEAQQRIDSQMPLIKKHPYADAIIDNNGSLKWTRTQLENIFNDWGIV